MNLTIANRLVELRQSLGLSQEALAASLGVSRQAVSKWERAEASPDTDNLIALANLYDISLDALLLGREAPPTPVGEAPRPVRGGRGEGGAQAAEKGTPALSLSRVYHLVLPVAGNRIPPVASRVADFSHHSPLLRHGIRDGLTFFPQRTAARKKPRRASNPPWF